MSDRAAAAERAAPPRHSPLERIFAGVTPPPPLAFVEQFLATPARDYRVVLEGVMEEVVHRPALLGPLFALLGALGVLVPRTGRDIPATLEVVPGYDAAGAPWHDWKRTFAFPRPVRFNTRVVYDARYGAIADRVGRGHFLHMVWAARYTPPDTFTLATITNALRVGGRLLYLPRVVWEPLLGRVDFVQRCAPAAPDRTTVHLRILHPWFGEIFAYRGSFRVVRRPKEAGA